MDHLQESARGRDIFVSYSHADRKWLDRLLQHLRPLVRERQVRVFSDISIRPGAEWRAEIQVGLDTAGIAILLVSSAFLASDFIMDEEVPRLLAAASERGTVIMPVIVAPSLFDMVPSLARYQAVNPPSRPLSAMRPSEWSRVFVDLAREIHSAS